MRAAFDSSPALSARGRSFLRRYLAKIFSEKIQGARPGCGIGVGAVTVPTLAIEGVAGSRIEIKLMELSYARQLSIERAHLVERSDLGGLANLTRDRAGALRR